MRFVLGIAAGLGLIASCLALARVPNLAEAPKTFLVLFGAAFACYAVGVRALASKRPARTTRASLVLILGVALAGRLVLWPAPPTLSTDAYRYVWDARVAHTGMDPYRYPASAPELSALRDDRIYPRLNHPSWRTIYPPGAQAFFRGVYGLAPDSVLAMKAAIGLGELLALGLLLALLDHLGLPLRRSVVYAWNPLVLVEIWGSGHLDGLILPVVIGAALAAVTARPLLVGTLLGAATLVKLYPAVLLPLFLGLAVTRSTGRARRLTGYALAIFLGVVLVGYAPVARLGGAALGSLPRYLAEENFNHGLARTLVDHPAASFIAIAGWIAWATWFRRGEPLGARARRLVGGVTVLAPNVFPWYAVWLVPFLALAPSVGWITFTGTMALAYTFFFNVPWAIPTWARVVEFTPVLLCALAGLRRMVPPRPVTARGRQEFTSL